MRGSHPAEIPGSSMATGAGGEGAPRAQRTRHGHGRGARVHEARMVSLLSPATRAVFRRVKAGETVCQTRVVAKRGVFALNTVFQIVCHTLFYQGQRIRHLLPRLSWKRVTGENPKAESESKIIGELGAGRPDFGGRWPRGEVLGGFSACWTHAEYSAQ